MLWYPDKWDRRDSGSVRRGSGEMKRRIRRTKRRQHEIPEPIHVEMPVVVGHGIRRTKPRAAHFPALLNRV